MPLATPDPCAARTLVPESTAVIQSFLVLEKNLLVQERVDGFSRVRVFDLAGKAQAPIPVPASSYVSEIVPLENDALLLLVQSYVQPPAWYEYRLGKAGIRRTKLETTYANADFRPYEVVREHA